MNRKPESYRIKTFKENDSNLRNHILLSDRELERAERAMAKDMYAKIKIKEKPFSNLSDRQAGRTRIRRLGQKDRQAQRRTGGTDSDPLESLTASQSRQFSPMI